MLPNIMKDSRFGMHPVTLSFPPLCRSSTCVTAMAAWTAFSARMAPSSSSRCWCVTGGTTLTASPPIFISLSTRKLAKFPPALLPLEVHSPQVPQASQLPHQLQLHHLGLRDLPSLQRSRFLPELRLEERSKTDFPLMQSTD